MPHSNLLDTVEHAIRTVDLPLTCVKATPADQQSFGDCLAIFRTGNLLFRIVRDRGRELVGIAPDSLWKRLFDPANTDFYSISDIEIAFEWRTIEEVIAKKEPDPLDQVFKRIAPRIKELQKAFSKKHIKATREKILTAQLARAAAYKARRMAQ